MQFKMLPKGLPFFAASLFSAAMAMQATPSWSQTTAESLATRGYVNLAVVNEPPMSMLKPDGSVSGASPDLIAEAMRRIGVAQTRGAAFEFAAMIPALLAGQVDSVGGALLITEQRCGAVIFSEPLLTLQVVILVPKGNPNKITSVKAFVDNPSLRLIVVQGTGPAARVEALGVRNTVVLSENLQQREALRGRRGDATLINEAVLAARPEILKEFDLVRPPENEFPVLLVGAAFRKADVALRNRFDQALAQMKADGSVARIAGTYGLDTKLLGTRTRASISATCS